MISNICPVCEVGILSQYAGHLNYSSCDTCDYDIANSEQLIINKRNKQMNNETTISTEDYNRLVLDSKLLAILDSNGMDNWWVDSIKELEGDMYSCSNDNEPDLNIEAPEIKWINNG